MPSSGQLNLNSLTLIVSPEVLSNSNRTDFIIFLGCCKIFRVLQLYRLSKDMALIFLIHDIP